MTMLEVTQTVERYGRLVHLGFSGLNSLILAVIVVTLFYSDSKRNDEDANRTLKEHTRSIRALELQDNAIAGTIARGQQEVTNRLTALESQTQWIVRTLDRIEKVTTDRIPR